MWVREFIFLKLIVQYCVYIIYSKLIDRYYIGCSSDPQRRVYYHNKGKGGGKNPYTKRSHDWELIWQRKYRNRKDALQYEKYLKREKSRKFIKQIITEGGVAQW
jgi:putative endonuclease